jgi:hypothetical protein
MRQLSILAVAGFKAMMFSLQFASGCCQHRLSPNTPAGHRSLLGQNKPAIHPWFLHLTAVNHAAVELSLVE